jgi:cytidyltransferase-like protein
MDTVTTNAAVRERVQRWRADGARIAFVPTMGNLHSGHISLIEAARRGADRFVASIFVNPMQFGPNEDFAHYPRTAAKDAAMLSAAGCDLMFMPDAREIYPDGFERATRVEVPELSRILCGQFRPGHFEGVTTVVARLFNIVAPDVAVFGEKDYQQLTIIRRMVADMCYPIEIRGGTDGARGGRTCHELAQSIFDSGGAPHRPAPVRRAAGRCAPRGRRRSGFCGASSVREVSSSKLRACRANISRSVRHAPWACRRMLPRSSWCWRRRA